jgi:hypothetical protein
VNQKRFKVLQNSIDVISNLNLPGYLRGMRGEQFVLTIVATSSAAKPVNFDIYVDRNPVGEPNVVKGLEDMDNIRIVKCRGHVRPDDEGFSMIIIFQKSGKQSNEHADVYISSDFVKRLQEAESIEAREAVELLLISLGIEDSDT